MALINIEYGSIASSETLNNNFEFLKDEIEAVDAKIYANSSTLESQIATLNANLLAKIEDIDEIGVPILTLSNTLRDNEIWLEGAIVSRITYSILYSKYGTTYGEGDGSLTFGLPDFRNRALWGSDTFGYLSAALPNITGSFISLLSNGSNTFYENGTYWTNIRGASGSYNFRYMYFDASRGSSIYQSGCSTVQPPAIKVRVKTRYQ